MTRRLGLLLALAGLLPLAAPAHAALRPPFGHQGRWITDAQGRVVVLHGVNMVDKFAPYRPDALGFGADDARFLARHGFDSVRLGIIWKGLEPTRRHYDERYLDRIARTAHILERYGLHPVLDFHQDMLNERYQGEGLPDWALRDGGRPAVPRLGFPINYVAMPALSAAFESFWTNRARLQNAFAAAWRHVAARFGRDPAVVALDIFNEPWPGAVRFDACRAPHRCPAFDRGLLRPFTRRTARAIRGADRRRLVAYEPNLGFNTGARTYLGAPAGPRAVFDFHVYCNDATPGLPASPAAPRTCPRLEDLPFVQADRQSRATRDALLLTEFGATDDRRRLASLAAIADRHRVGWEEWTYWGRDPCCRRPDEGLVRTPHRPPAGANVKRGKLRTLARAYPRAVAGTPTAWTFQPKSRRFALRYRTRRAGGGRIRRRVRTEVVLPRLQYPHGYRLAVRGARVRSRPGAAVLRLTARPGAHAVTVRVRPR